MIDRVVHVRSLDVTDSMFAADRPAKFDRKLECFLDAFPSAGDLVRIFAVEHEIDMDIAVAGVPEIRDERIVAFTDLLDPRDKFGYL